MKSLDNPLKVTRWNGGVHSRACTLLNVYRYQTNIFCKSYSIKATTSNSRRCFPHFYLYA